MKHVVLASLLFALFACASTNVPAGIDWKSLEGVSATTNDPLSLRPEVEPFNLRIPLFNVESVGVHSGWKVMTGGTPQIQPLGVDLGNALAIDATGAVFLDILKLLRIDTDSPFSVERKQASLLGSRTTLIRDSSGFGVRSPRARGTVEMSADAITVTGPNGGEVISVKLENDTYTYRSSNTFDLSSRMAVSDGRLVVKSSMMHDLIIQESGPSVKFNPSSDVDFPAYTVTKDGDSYSVRYVSNVMDITFKIYYTADSVYLLRNGIVIRSVKVTDSSILIDGKEEVTYSKG